ncbi:MAG TPA: hypothetical protein VFW11_16610 [Cyclobacteriaceae bacterium]|nr:hypothetical protein [Cyclobacteriaceae bacterium]
MATEAEIGAFLRDFKFKLNFRDRIAFLSRSKNFNTIKDLELSVLGVKEELKKIEVVDYCQGPLEEVVFEGMPMWVFGRTIKIREVYIKITMGKKDEDPICISFHFSEFPMTYPFKGK